jgi:hypothetical protein
MGKRVTFSVSAWSAAEPKVVFDLLTSGATWPVWSPIGSFHLEKEGDEGGESCGAIRVFRTGSVRSRERIVAVEPNRQLSYVQLSGLPIRSHRADVVLEPDEYKKGTRIVWREDFEASLPGTGWLFRWFLGRFVQRCADGLAAHTAKGASATP